MSMREPLTALLDTLVDTLSPEQARTLLDGILLQLAAKAGRTGRHFAAIADQAPPPVAEDRSDWNRSVRKHFFGAKPVEEAVSVQPDDPVPEQAPNTAPSTPITSAGAAQHVLEVVRAAEDARSRSAAAEVAPVRDPVPARDATQARMTAPVRRKTLSEQSGAVLPHERQAVRRGKTSESQRGVIPDPGITAKTANNDLFGVDPKSLTGLQSNEPLLSSKSTIDVTEQLCEFPDADMSTQPPDLDAGQQISDFIREVCLRDPAIKNGQRLLTTRVVFDETPVPQINVARANAAAFDPLVFLGRVLKREPYLLFVRFAKPLQAELDAVIVQLDRILRMWDAGQDFADTRPRFKFSGKTREGAAVVDKSGRRAPVGERAVIEPYQAKIHVLASSEDIGQVAVVVV